jgi:hypothetical protein
MNYFIPKDVRASKCNLHLLWVAIVFGFVITNPSVPNLGYYSSSNIFFIAGG